MKRKVDNHRRAIMSELSEGDQVRLSYSSATATVKEKGKNSIDMGSPFKTKKKLVKILKGATQSFS